MKQPVDLIKGRRYRIKTAETESKGFFTGYHDDGSMYFMGPSGVIMVFPEDWEGIIAL